MPVYLTCLSCGNRIAVTEWDASALRKCECGEVIQVPSLEELRRQMSAELASKKRPSPPKKLSPFQQGASFGVAMTVIYSFSCARLFGPGQVHGDSYLSAFLWGGLRGMIGFLVGGFIGWAIGELFGGDERTKE